MSAMLAVLISILAGISAGAGVMAFLIRRFPRQAEPRLVDPRLFRTVFEAGEDEVRNSLGRRMRWAGIPFGAVPLAIISAVFAVSAFGIARGAGLNGAPAALAMVVGALIPLSLARWWIARRERAFAEGFQPLTEGLLRGLASGLDMRSSFALAVEGTPEPLRSALAPVARNLLLGHPVRDGMRALRQAAPSPFAALFASALAQHAENGGRLHDCLAALADRLREEKRMRQKRDAAAAEASSASAILLTVPAVLLLGMRTLMPEYFALLSGTAPGRAALTLSACFILAGRLIMQRMVAAALPRSGP